MLSEIARMLGEKINAVCPLQDNRITWWSDMEQ